MKRGQSKFTLTPLELKSEAETEGWGYDPNGNRTSDNLNPGTWSYDLNDRLKESPAASYVYDAAGNTTSKTEGSVTSTYIYNAEGRLSRIEDDGHALIAEYIYDPMGRRIKKTTQIETLYFDYADEGLVGEYDANGSAVRQYGYAPGSTWTTDPLYQKTENGYAYYQNDHLGTPQQLVRKNGSRVWKGSYFAFGGIKSKSGVWENRLRFPGQYFDDETGTYYNYFRNYDPTTGRYLQSDPIGFEGGMNAYMYGDNNPINLYDTYGRQVIECGFKPKPPKFKCKFLDNLSDEEICYCDFVKELATCSLKGGFTVVFCEKRAELKYAECLRKVAAGER